MLTNTDDKQSLESTIHGSFILADVEFALPAQVIQEVVNEPESYDPMPLAPEYALGLLNLRGVIMPVVDIRILFEIEGERTANKDTNKIAIIEYDGFCMGLLFNDTREVFNATSVDQCLFGTDDSNPARRSLKGVFKLDQGRRIVHIIDVRALFNLEGFPKTKVENAKDCDKGSNVRHQCISFVVNESRFSLDINIVKEIISFEKIDNKILSSNLCLGAIELRGETIPIVDFSQLVGFKKTDSKCEANRIIILQRNSYAVGMLVESIDSIVTYFERDLVPFPDLSSDHLFKGSLKDTINNVSFMLIDHKKLLSSKAIEEITEGHGTLFQSTAESGVRSVDGAFNWQSLITFSLDSCYALDIRDVKEVITQPVQLLTAPTSCPHIKGMFDLRGEMVTLINSSGLCRDKENADNGDDAFTKVIVFECHEIKYGLLVRSVDSIVRYSDKDTMTMPKSMSRSANDANWTIGNAVDKALRVNNSTISILDLNRIAAQVSA